MAEIAKGDKIINKKGQEGEIISFDDRYVTTQFQGRIAKFLRSAFDEGYLVHRKTLDEMSLDELYQFGNRFYDKEDEENAIRYITLAAERGSVAAACTYQWKDLSSSTVCKISARYSIAATLPLSAARVI